MRTWITTDTHFGHDALVTEISGQLKLKMYDKDQKDDRTR